MKYILIILLRLFMMSSLAGEVFEKPLTANKKITTKRHIQLIKVLNDEYRLISKLLKGKRRNNSKLHYRRLELYSEKLKLTFEYENNRFLTSSPLARKKMGKKSFFKKTRALYQKSQQMGEGILKRFKRFKKKAEVYYTLGLNSRDYGRDNRAADYLLQAIKIAKKSEPVYFAAKATLADYFYNEKKYHFAIPYYEDVIKNTKTEWMPKYAYNLSWCYLKKKRFPKAIKTIKHAFFQSGKNGMIDVSSQVLFNIGIFYAYAQEVEEGISFYVKNADEPVYYLKKMGKMLMERGLFDVSEKSLVQGLELTKNRAEKIEINAILLSLYKQFVKINKHYQLSNTLYRWHQEQPFNPEQISLISERLNNLVSYLQLKVSQKIYDNDMSLQAKKMSMVVGYFKMLSEIDKKESSKYLFLMGETYYSMENYKVAMSVYKKSLKIAVKDKKEEKLKTQILNSMLSVLGMKKIPKLLKKKYLIPTYANYLLVFPKAEKSQIIYRNIFEELMKSKKVKSANKYLSKYHKTYPYDLNFQRGMATKIMENYINNKDATKLSLWIRGLRKGYLSFPEEVIEKSEHVLGQILFNDYQSLVAKGRVDEAIKGYKTLFSNPIYPKKIKAKSAYNASLLNLNQNNIDESYKWVKIAMPLFEDKEVVELSSSIESMVVEYSERLDFSHSAKLALFSLNFFCENSKVRKNTFFHLASTLNFLEGKRRQSLLVLEKSSKCGIEVLQQEKTERQLIEIASLSEHHHFFFKMHKYFTNKSKYKNEMDKVLFQLYKYHKTTKESLISKLSKKYLLKNKEQTGFHRYIDGYFKTEAFVQKYQNYKTPVFVQKEKFDEKLYNQWLQEQISGMTKITDEGISLANLGHGDLKISVFKVLNLVYGNLSKAISVIKPLGRDHAYIAGFRKNMKDIEKGLDDKAYEYTALAKRQVKSESIINENASWVLTPKLSPVQISYSYLYKGILMDSMRGL